MKKTLKLALACTLGAAFVFVGCTKDYSSDISKLDTRVSAIEKEDVANRLKKLEDADATFKTQLESIDKAISLTNETIEKMQGEIDGELAAIKTKLNLCATKQELTDAVAGIYKNVYKKNETYSKEQIDGLLELTITLGGQTYTFKSVYEMVDAFSGAAYLSAKAYTDQEIAALKATLEAADAKLSGRIAALEAWKITAQKAIDENAEDIANEITRAKKAESDLKDALSAVEARVKTIETNLGDFTNSEYIAYKEKMKETVKELQDKIDDLYSKYADLKADVDDIAVRINSIAAKAPVGDDNVEARQFLFGDIDKTKIIMTFNITPGIAASRITAANSKLVVTEGQTRTDLTKAVTDDCTEYTFYGDPVVVGKAVKVAAFVQSKLNKENRYWASLKFYGTDEAGVYTIASAPVEVIEGECIDLTNPANLVWYNKNDVKVNEDNKYPECIQNHSEYQYYAPDGKSAPTLVTALNKVCYKDVYLQGEKDIKENVFDGYYLRVKTEKGDKKLSELKVDFDLTDAQIAITAGKGVQTVNDPANKYWGDYEGKTRVAADPKLFTYTSEALGDVDVKVAYPDEYFVGDQTVAKRWLAVGTSSKYTIPAIKIGAVSYPGLEAIHRTYFSGHVEKKSTKITNFKPEIKWDYINWDYTTALAGNGDSNGAFYGYDLVADANMQIINMFKGVAADKPLMTNITYKFLDSSRRVDLFIDAVAVSGEDQELKAEWEKSDIDHCEPTGVAVNTYTYSTELPFTVKARHANVDATYAPDAFAPNQAKADVIKLGSIVDNKFTDDVKNWTGSLNKTLANVKAAYKTALDAAAVNINVKEGKTDVTSTLGGKFKLNKTTGDLTITAGALDYNKTYTVTYTWTIFGVTFKDIITLTTKLPKYALMTRPMYVKDGKVMIEGQLEDFFDTWWDAYYDGKKDKPKPQGYTPQAYVIQDAHMNKYVYVEDYDVVTGETGTGETLTVEFALDKSSAVGLHAPKGIGYIDLNKCGVEENQKDGVLAEDIFACWNRALWKNLTHGNSCGTYKGAAVKVTATLKANGRKVNDVTFTIEREDPIQITASYDIEVNKVSAEGVTVNALKNLSVIGKLPYDMEEKTAELFDGEEDYNWLMEKPHYNYGQYNKLAAQHPHIFGVPGNIKIDWAKLTADTSTPLYEGVDYELNKVANEITIIADNAGVEYTISIPVEITMYYGETPYKTTAKIHVKQGK